MVGHVRGFLEMIRAVLPEMVELLRKSELWAGSETNIGEPVYEGIRSVDFSQDVLSVQTRRLVTLRMGLTGWSDLGHPERAMAVLQAAGLEPWWMKEWKNPKRSPALEPSRVSSAVA